MSIDRDDDGFVPSPPRGVGWGPWLGHLLRQPRLVRALLRYGSTKGNLLAGGVTFYAIISLSAALTLLVNITRGLLPQYPEVFDSMVRLVNRVLPNMFAVDGRDGVVAPEALLLPSGFHWTSLVAVIVALWAAALVMTGLRLAVRTMFGLGDTPTRFLIDKTRDVVGFIALGVAVLASTALVSATVIASEPVFAWLRISDSWSQLLLRIIAVVLSGFLDALITWMLLRMLARVRIPRRDLTQGMVLGALYFGVVRVLGTTIITLSNNPLLASVAAIATLVVWINLAVRGLLLISAWTANPPAPAMITDPDAVYAKQRPNYVTLSSPPTLTWRHHPVSGALAPLIPSDPRHAIFRKSSGVVLPVDFTEDENLDGETVEQAKENIRRSAGGGPGQD